MFSPIINSHEQEKHCVCERENSFIGKSSSSSSSSRRKKKKKNKEISVNCLLFGSPFYRKKTETVRE